MALLGEIRDGAFLRELIGRGATSVLEALLGAQFESLLPLVVSACALFGFRKYRMSGEGHGASEED
jgi:hypothetical protein